MSTRMLNRVLSRVASHRRAVGLVGTGIAVGSFAAPPVLAQQSRAASSTSERVSELEVRLANLEGILGKRTLSLELLERSDDKTSNAIIDLFDSNDDFLALAQKTTDSIVARDAEDDDKLQKGIDIAVAKGVLPGNVQVEPTCQVDVTGKTADQVADEIISHLGDLSGSEGRVIIMQGLSGTGKGTTVSKLESKLPNVVCWSNGNLFRSLTLFAVTYCEQQNITFGSDILTPSLLQKCMGMLEFGQFNGKYDIKLDGLGIQHYVSDVATTVLKGKKVGKNIPTVAEKTQGEVIAFASAAVNEMGKGGYNVIMEGRAQTLNHVRSPYRFELVMADTSLIGKRRLAQRLGGEVLNELKGTGASTDAINDALRGTLKKLVAEDA